MSNPGAFRREGIARFDNESAAPVRTLSQDARMALERHFLALDTDDRRLRFSIPIGDAAGRAYVESIDFDQDAPALPISVTATSRRNPGLSVLPGYRNRGCGSALLARASLRAWNWGVARLFMHCLTENDAIMHLARKQGMKIATDVSEAKAWLELPAADASSLFHDLHEQGVSCAALRGCGAGVTAVAGFRRSAIRFQPGWRGITTGIIGSAASGSYRLSCPLSEKGTQ